jgi:hypothetical protein
MPYEFTFGQIHDFDISPNREKAIVFFDLMPLMTREQILKSEPTPDIYKFVVIDLMNMTYEYFDADSVCSSPIWGVFNSDSSLYICGNCKVEEMYINGNRERILAGFNEDSEECGLFALLNNRYLIGYEAFSDYDSIASTHSFDFNLVYFDKASDYERIVIDSGYIAPWGTFDEKGCYYYADLFDTATASANIYRYSFNDKNMDTILTMNGDIFGLQIR